ncbi:MAG: Rieske 2Fe-2S domain-containing protein [Ferruginibacter sp.]|nr:Rieske 2Fe-2S domain-containing protein [Ferruginibacter sp.]
MHQQNDYNWYKLADSLQELTLSEGGLKEQQVNGKKICVALHNGTLYGCAAKCPHASGNLADGYIDALGNIVCPIHRYKFSLQSGRNTSGEGYHLKQYPIQMRADGIFIGFRADNIIG